MHTLTKLAIAIATLASASAAYAGIPFQWSSDLLQNRFGSLDDIHIDGFTLPDGMKLIDANITGQVYIEGIDSTVPPTIGTSDQPIEGLSRIRSVSEYLSPSHTVYEYNVRDQVAVPVGAIHFYNQLLKHDYEGHFSVGESFPGLLSVSNYRALFSVTGELIPVLDGDFTGDGTVDAADYTSWRDNLGRAYSSADYQDWAANFGTTHGSTLPIPEPNCAVLLFLSSCIILHVGQRKFSGS